MEIKTTIPELKRTITVDYDFGSNLDEAVDKFSSDAIYNDFVASARITVQSRVRSLARAGKSDEEIIATFADWKPGIVTRGKKDPVAEYLARFAKMTPEAQENALAKLMSVKK